MIFNMIDQINDIKVRNLSNRHSQPGAIGEEMEKELDEKLADDADTMNSSDLESPLPTKAPTTMEEKPKDPNVVSAFKTMLTTGRANVYLRSLLTAPTTL